MKKDHPSRRDILKSLGIAGAGLAVGSMSKSTQAAEGSGSRPRGSGKSVGGLKVPAMKTVRIGFIGVGARGSGHVGSCLKCEGIEVNAICDTHEPAAKGAANRCVKAGRKEPTVYSGGDYAYRKMLERDDLDIVLISTPWRWHAPMCIDAMLAGKHALTEVPAAVTLEECWQLVDTAEKTQLHCMMLENVCYGREELMVLNMCRQGLFGELTHGEAAYIHNLRGQMRQHPRGTGSWRTPHHAKRNGNLYPTHGLGPVAQYMSINRGDRFDYLSSMSSPALGRQEFAEEHLPENHPFRKLKYICGDMNTSLIKTVKGRSVVVQHDTTTNRPYDRINLIQGTKGTFRGYPDRICVGKHSWEELGEYRKKYEHPLYTRMGEEAKKAGGHGGMDFLMIWRTIYCLRNGEALDQDVYDAAAWSAVGPLSEQSVANRSTSVDYPDFTRGAWKTMEPLGIVS